MTYDDWKCQSPYDQDDWRDDPDDYREHDVNDFWEDEEDG